MFGFERKTIKISQRALYWLAMRWEPSASASPPSYRRATCVVCGKPMWRMWHLWISYHDHGTRFIKEIHMCRRCGKPYEYTPPREQE